MNWMTAVNMNIAQSVAAMKCELGDCQNDAYLYVDMFPEPVAVCLDCYLEHGFKEY